MWWRSLCLSVSLSGEFCNNFCATCLHKAPRVTRLWLCITCSWNRGREKESRRVALTRDTIFNKICNESLDESFHTCRLFSCVMTWIIGNNINFGHSRQLIHSFGNRFKTIPRKSFQNRFFITLNVKASKSITKVGLQYTVCRWAVSSNNAVRKPHLRNFRNT